MTTRPSEKQCVEMWEQSTSSAEYEAMYDKFIVDHTERYIDIQKLFCMRCGAWDAKQCRPDERMCGLNCVILTPGKICGYNCKLQRYQANLRARGLL